MGLYPSAPDLKIYYNEDGSTVYTRNTTGGILTTSSNTGSLNSESHGNSVTVSPSSQQLGFLFPEVMDIRGIYYEQNGGNSQTTVQYSANTTDGDNGTWTTWTTTFQTYGQNTNGWRNLVVAVPAGAITGARGLLITHPPAASGSACNVHLYGHRTNPGAYQGLVLERTDGTALTGADVDWGDVPKSGSSILSMRVRNTHSQTANNVTANTVGLSSPSPSLPSQTTVSVDGTTWSAVPAALGTLAPAATKSFQVRLMPTASAQLALWRQRLLVSAASWT
jgi:hypothetical protein